MGCHVGGMGEFGVGGLKWHAMRVGRLLRSTEGVGAESHRVRVVQGGRFEERGHEESRGQAGWAVAVPATVLSVCVVEAVAAMVTMMVTSLRRIVRLREAE